MELTRTDAVFSITAMVLFLGRNESSQNVLKYTENFSVKYEKYLRKDPPEGMGQWATSPIAAASPTGRGYQACRAHVALLPPIPALFIPFRPGKNQESRFHRVSRSRGVATSRSCPGGQISSPFWAPKRGNRRHRHHQPSSLSNSMKLFVVRE